MDNKSTESASENAANEASESPTHAPEATECTPAQLQELQTKAAKADENWDKLLRLTADFDNYKKRAAREKQDAIRYANEGLIEKLLPVLDNFDMALGAVQSAPQATPDSFQSLQTGITMIRQQLKSALIDSGLEEIDASQGAFDPNWQEAVSQQESSDIPEGHILQQLRRGYKLRDRLLRPAMVVVAKAPATPQ